MTQDLLDALKLLADETRAQLDRQLRIIESIRDIEAASANIYQDLIPQAKPRKKVIGRAINRTDKHTGSKAKPAELSESQRFIADVIALIKEEPLSRREIMEGLGLDYNNAKHRQDVKNATTRLKVGEFPEWTLLNKGTARRAKWFVSPSKAAHKR